MALLPGSACGNLCTHDEITTDGSNLCKVCKIPIVIEATNLLNGEDIGPYYLPASTIR